MTKGSFSTQQRNTNLYRANINSTKGRNQQQYNKSREFNTSFHQCTDHLDIKINKTSAINAKLDQIDSVDSQHFIQKQ